MSTVEKLEAAGEVLAAAVRALPHERDALAAQVAEMRERTPEPQARPGQNSTSSSHPPSSDPPGVERRKKKSSGRRRGGRSRRVA
jgi:transposase